MPQRSVPVSVASWVACETAASSRFPQLPDHERVQEEQTGGNQILDDHRSGESEKGEQEI